MAIFSQRASALSSHFIPLLRAKFWLQSLPPIGSFLKDTNLQTFQMKSWDICQKPLSSSGGLVPRILASIGEIAQMFPQPLSWLPIFVLTAVCQCPVAQQPALLTETPAYLSSQRAARLLVYPPSPYSSSNWNTFRTQPEYFHHPSAPSLALSPVMFDLSEDNGAP